MYPSRFLDHHSRSPAHLPHHVPPMQHIPHIQRPLAAPRKVFVATHDHLKLMNQFWTVLDELCTTSVNGVAGDHEAGGEDDL